MSVLVRQRRLLVILLLLFPSFGVHPNRKWQRQRPRKRKKMGSKRAILFGHLSLTLPHFAASASVAGAAALSTFYASADWEGVRLWSLLHFFFFFHLFPLFFFALDVCACDFSLTLTHCWPPSIFVSDNSEQMWNSSHIVLASLYFCPPPLSLTPWQSPLFALDYLLSSSIGRLSVHRSWVGFFFAFSPFFVFVRDHVCSISCYIFRLYIHTRLICH